MNHPSGPAPRQRPNRPPAGRGPRRHAGVGLTGALLAVVAVPVVAAIAALLLATLAALLANDRLPSLEVLTDYRPKLPLRVFTADGELIGEFGEERRSVVRIDDVPPVMKNAVLAAEDARFFEHAGVDPVGIARAAITNLFSGGRDQGASTITMQVARNFFLSSEKTYTRKIYEILLALRIEENLSKQQILEIYLNQIFLGKRAYGFASAAQIYFGKSLQHLSAAEAAMLAGLPKAPSLYNPLVNPRRATERQHYILRRMLEAGFLTDAQYEAALAEKLRYAPPQGAALHAPYVAETARLLAFDLFQEDIYGAGLNVYTTIRSDDQRAANAAVRRGVVDYDRKYGYRGPESVVELPADPTAAEDVIDDLLADTPAVEEFVPAVVLQVQPKSVRASLGHGTVIEIGGDGLKFAARALGDRAPAAQRLRRGALIRVVQDARSGDWQIGQIPEVQAALVSVNTTDGAVRAMVGGFDFSRNKFNRVIQAWRQPGSSFKPFIYSASLEKGLTTTTIINDAPIYIDPAITGGQPWEPKNYDGKFEGPMPMRRALAKSKNMVSIRILQSIGPRYAQDYIGRFGFDPERHPPYLTMALGAGAVTPLQMAGAYSVFANGGFRVEPYLVSRITDSSGRVLAQAHPARAGDESLRAIDERNAFIMTTLLRDVVRYGTAARAQSLKRNDIAGKTGTTNDSHDAWFAGYQPGIAAVAWVGFDQPRKLGDRETGGGLALPVWIAYMGQALRGVPEQPAVPPQGVVSVDGDWYYVETQPGQGIASLGVTLDAAPVSHDNGRGYEPPTRNEQLDRFDSLRSDPLRQHGTGP